MKGTSKTKSVVIAGYYGFGNAGDELILLSIVRQLRRENPGIPVTVLSASPRQTAEHFGVRAVNRWKPWAWVRPLWDAHLFILGGGGLLQESTGPWNYSYYLSLVVLAKCLGCRTEVRALGVDLIERGWNRFLARLVLDGFSDVVSVRDIDSQRALESARVYHRLWRVPDPVFFLEKPSVQKISSDRPRIGWALAPWDQRLGWEHDLALLLERVGAQLQAVNELLLFFPAHDEALTRRVSELTPSPTVVRRWTQPEDLLTWIQEYDLVIGMRYHALVLAALTERPFIGWGFQRKVRTLCGEFNQPMWTFERGWDSESVFRQINDAWKRRKVLTERYQAQLNQLRKSSAMASDSARIFVAST